MSNKKGDIPGFYRDPKTGKYYRENPENNINPSLKKLKKVREDETFQNENYNKRPEISSVLKYLRTKELGAISGLQAERQYFKMRIYNKELKEEVSLNDFQSHNIVSVHFIKGSRLSVFGVWNITESSKFRCVIGERTFFGLPYHPNLGFKACRNYVIDMCEGPDDTIVYLYNHPFSGVGCYAFLPQMSDNIDVFGGALTKSSFCCSSARRGSTIAFGCEGSVRFFNRFSYEKTYCMKGRVHTLSFNEPSNLMISGVHTGHLYLHDMRQKKLQMDLEVSENCINDSCFIDPDQVIVAGPGDMLIKIDLRMKKTVAEYYGHKSSMKKRPFSVANNMLCASGADNTIRIWHLAGGNPLYEMKPVNSPENETRGWLYSDCNKTYLYQFEEHFKRIYDIT